MCFPSLFILKKKVGVSADRAGLGNSAGALPQAGEQFSELKLYLLSHFPNLQNVKKCTGTSKAHKCLCYGIAVSSVHTLHTDGEILTTELLCGWVCFH